MINREHLTSIGLPILLFVIGTGFGYSLGTVRERDLIERQRIIHDRYPVIYPFSTENSKHVFHEHHNGGMIQIVANNASSTQDISRIQDFLKIQYDRYKTGNFSDEAKLHGTNMPGIAKLSENYSKVQFVYSDIPNGGQIQLITEDPILLEAIHVWFRAQLLDHGSDAISHMGVGEM